MIANCDCSGGTLETIDYIMDDQQREHNLYVKVSNAIPTP